MDCNCTKCHIGSIKFYVHTHNTEYGWMYMYNYYIEISFPINGIRLLYTCIKYASNTKSKCIFIYVHHVSVSGSTWDIV